jgi:hypothetical protein
VEEPARALAEVLKPPGGAEAKNLGGFAFSDARLAVISDCRSCISESSSAAQPKVEGALEREVFDRFVEHAGTRQITVWVHRSATHTDFVMEMGGGDAP